jgi:glycosyltransferase involved in cell wall biosynthesis
MNDSPLWIVCQIGAREHYAIPRALEGDGKLERLITDLWVPPHSWISQFPKTRRLRDRNHSDLTTAKVEAFNIRMLSFELKQRFRRVRNWELVIRRNQLFQKLTVAKLKSISKSVVPVTSPKVVFSYSYAALEIFRFAKQLGWTTVLGQIDPGPREEQIVQAELKRVGNSISHWQPAPEYYWKEWRAETELADRILVNSTWSRQCLRDCGIPESKMEVVPLVYTPSNSAIRSTKETVRSFDATRPLRVLFLGQVNLRKGTARLLDAMRLLQNEPVELILAGPTDMDSNLWKDLENVRFVGPVARSEVSRYYLDADVFVLPTLSDGFALTQLEALAYGLPVIASRNCGEVVQHGKNGLLLEDVEPETIANAIRNFVRQPIFIGKGSAATFGLSELSAALTRSVA